MSVENEILDALDYFWQCEDVEIMTTDRRHYLKIVLNNVSKKYKLNHIYKF